MYYFMRCIKKIPFDGTHLSLNKSDALQNALLLRLEVSRRDYLNELKIACNPT